MDLEIREARQKGWFFIDNIFVDSFAKKLKTSGIVVYMSLCRHADNKTQECFPTMEGIAKQHGISKSTVIRAIKRLEEFNLIHVEREVTERENGVQKKNRYTLLDKNVWQGVTDETLDKIPKQGVKRDKSRVSPEYYKETHINKTHIVADATVQPLDVKEFNNKESLDKLLTSEERDVKILGHYFKRKGIVFSSQKELSQAIAVNRSMIKAFTKKNGMHPFDGIPSEKILKAMDYAKEKFPDWSLKVIMERCFEIGK
ncbi:MAG TPA: helix-turn-helix domain-containing protein [Candidatus Paceibacterota bacterium]|nr:helix-turn-helix domain-containing protein [Candidatus Paceibacterota bacterium]